MKSRHLLEFILAAATAYIMSRNLLSALPLGTEDRILCAFRPSQLKSHSKSRHRAHLRLYSCREELDFALGYVAFVRRFRKRYGMPNDVLVTSLHHLEWPAFEESEVQDANNYEDDVIRRLTQLANETIKRLQTTFQRRSVVVPFIFNKGLVPHQSLVRERQGIIIIAPCVRECRSLVTPGSRCFKTLLFSESDNEHAVTNPDSLTAQSSIANEVTVFENMPTTTAETVNDSGVAADNSDCDCNNPLHSISGHSNESTDDRSQKVAETGDNGPTQDPCKPCAKPAHSHGVLSFRVEAIMVIVQVNNRRGYREILVNFLFIYCRKTTLQVSQLQE